MFFCKGRTWRDLRKFTLRELSDLGMGKKDTMEAIILQGRERGERGEALGESHTLSFVAGGRGLHGGIQGGLPQASE